MSGWLGVLLRAFYRPSAMSSEAHRETGVTGSVQGRSARPILDGAKQFLREKYLFLWLPLETLFLQGAIGSAKRSQERVGERKFSVTNF